MITFHKIKYKNFLSSGNKFIKIDLDKSPTTAVSGLNGVGKSTFMDAITFALFKKAYRQINLPQLVNSVNEKDCLVEIEFSIVNQKWKVIRGLKPTIFEIYCNNKLIDQSASNVDQQKWFEQNVLKMNYKSFTQIVILGNSNFVPFMQLTPAARREVIEDLLDIKIFSSMNTVVKDKIKTLKEEVKFLDVKKDSALDKVEMQKNFMEELKKRGCVIIEEKQNKIQELIDQKTNIDSENSKIESILKKLNKDLNKLNLSSKKSNELITIKAKLSEKISILKNHCELFESSHECPTCTQKIDSEFKTNKISEISKEIDELNDAHLSISEKINVENERNKEMIEKHKDISSLNSKYSNNELKIQHINRNILELNTEIENLQTQIKNQVEETEKLNQFISDFETVNSDYESKKELMKYYDYTYGLLKDSGVKSKIIKKYLPIINQQIGRYLKMMEFYINFNLNEEFDEVIKSPIHEQFSYASFSEGEKARINLALLFAWREVAKLKNSTNTNLLIFDEIFDNSLDNMGTDEFLKIIKYVIKDANIFVISHKESLLDKFDNSLQFQKKGNFTSLKAST
jgi:DNA repair exonuclease SbcCD ATPase subunit